jgi:hypothetical protein
MAEHVNFPLAIAELFARKLVLVHSIHLYRSVKYWMFCGDLPRDGIEHPSSGLFDRSFHEW